MDPVFIYVFVLIVILNCLKAFLKARAQKKREQERLALRQVTSKSSEKHQSETEDLPPLVPVEASVAPTDKSTIETAPIGFSSDWSTPLPIDEDVLDTPTIVRKSDLTPFQMYQWMKPLKTPVVLVPEQKPASHILSAFLSAQEKPASDDLPDLLPKQAELPLKSVPVFNLDERFFVGFDGKVVV